MDKIKKLISFIPQNNLEISTPVESQDDPNRLEPEFSKILPENPTNSTT
jgi:acetyl-CoA carboxylase carboxyltransferase component